jgi:hypothetical protein
MHLPMGRASGHDMSCGARGTSGPDGLDLDLSGRDACGNGSDGGGDEDGSMGLEADSGAVSEVEGGVDGAVDAATPAVLISPQKRRSGSRGAKASSHHKHSSD